MSRDIQSILWAIELGLLELASLNAEGPAITIVHRYRLRALGSDCQVGEEVSFAVVSHAGRQAMVPLALAPRLLFDCLAKIRHSPQSASQIATRMRISDFYRQHGMNSGTPSSRKISRSCVKEYVKRIRKALACAFSQLSLPLDPTTVLVSELVGNEVLYRLRAHVSWVHINDIDQRQPRIREAA